MRIFIALIVMHLVSVSFADKVSSADALPSVAKNADILSGVAKNQKDEVVYLEKHEVQRDESGYNKFIRVEYFKPNNELFATMTSDFSKSRNVPDTTFEDKRFNSVATIRVVGKTVEFEEQKSQKVVEKKTIPFDDAMVASQGFDNFIRANAKKLDTQPVQFKFGVLDKKDFFTLTGVKKPKGSADEVEYGINASNWLFRLFASELRVVYESKSMRLKSFRGRSNILDDLGKAQDVVILYDWMEKK